MSEKSNSIFEPPKKYDLTNTLTASAHPSIESATNHLLPLSLFGFLISGNTST